MRPGPNGGMLQNGGTPGNPGGGRPPSDIRARCRGSFEQRIPILEQIADGEASERIEVPLFVVLQHAECPKCGDKLKATDPAAEAMVTVRGKVSPKARDRILAIGKLGVVGMDAGRADAEDVRARLALTIGILQAELAPELAERILARIEPVWRAA